MLGEIQEGRILPEYLLVYEDLLLSDELDQYYLCLAALDNVTRDGKKLYKREQWFYGDPYPNKRGTLDLRLRKDWLYRLDVDNFEPFV